jgi:glycosyltransferase involved in cell wall biosynthesis
MCEPCIPRDIQIAKGASLDMENSKKLISIVTPCYNEEGNVEELYRQIQEVVKAIPHYRFEHIFIDNASTDTTVQKIKAIAQTDKSVKLIVNNRNFGHIRSPYYGILQAKGDAVILMASDLQDPPYMIPKFIEQWEAGFKVVKAVKTQSKESVIMFAIRKAFYNFINRLSDIKLTKNFTGTGLYDQKVIAALREIKDPYPYFRGLISELGFEFAVVEFTQPTRKRGISKNNFYTLYDIAMLGITNHSKIPLRLAIFFGFLLSGLSLLTAIAYLVLKIIFWDYFQLGTAPMIIAIFFFSSVQLFFIGILGEYIGSIHTQVMNRPLVVEKERVNFEEDN